MSPKRPTSVAALAAVLAITGCQRPTGGGGTTTVIQNGPAATSAPNASSPASAKVTPLNDPQQLCHQVRILTRKLYAVVDPYWKLMVNAHGKTVSDTEISAAADEVTKVSGEVIPQLEGLVGPNAPTGVAGPIKNYIAAAKDFTNAISEGAPGDEQTPLASKFGTATDEMDKACKL